MPGPHKEPPPPPASAIPVDDADIIDVVVGADEERAHSGKRRKQHRAPSEPGVPRVFVAPEQNVLEDEEEARVRRMDGAGGSVESELAVADTARIERRSEERASESDRDSDIEGGSRNTRGSKI